VKTNKVLSFVKTAPEHPQAILTVPEGAAYMRLGGSTLYRLIARGVVPAIKVPGTAIVRLRREVLDGLLRQWEQSGRRRGRRRGQAAGGPCPTD
jgi:excisionase family DNA binding protein